MSEAILEARGLSVRYPDGHTWFGAVRSWRTAVDRLDLVVPRGRTLALVGESGCGKSSLARAVVGLQAAASGRLLFRPRGGPEQDLLALPPRAWKEVRRRIALVFQDNGSALDPRMRVWRSVAEPLAVHGLARGRELRRRAEELMARVALDPAAADRFPDEFSGGQRQRLGIARALATGPELLVCDEIVSALDVLVQRRILDLLAEIQRRDGVSLLFISHDLAVVSGFAHRTAVMRRGRLVEEGPTGELFARPRAAYTRELIAAAATLET